MISILKSNPDIAIKCLSGNVHCLDNLSLLRKTKRARKNKKGYQIIRTGSRKNEWYKLYVRSPTSYNFEQYKIS